VPTALVDERVDTRLGKIQLWRGGAGPPLVYLHSSMGEGPGEAMLESLADHVSVVAPMFPGFGESEGIEAIDDIEDAVFHLLDLLDTLGVGSPAVLGLTTGAWLGVELAARYPERVSALVLVNPVGLYVEGARAREIFGLRPGQMAREFFCDQEHPRAQLLQQLEGVLGQVPRVEIPFELMRPALQSVAATAKFAWNPYLHDPKLPRLLHRVRAATLVVRGTEDRILPPAHAQEYARLIAGARLVEVPAAGHMLGVEKPSAVVELVLGHLGLSA